MLSKLIPCTRAVWTSVCIEPWRGAKQGGNPLANTGQIWQSTVFTLVYKYYYFSIQITKETQELLASSQETWKHLMFLTLHGVKETMVTCSWSEVQL